MRSRRSPMGWLLSSLLAAGCAPLTQPRTHSGEPASIDARAVRDILLDVPHWLTTGFGPDARPFDRDDIDALTRAARRLQAYADADVMDGIALAIDASEAASADVFVMLRILYDVPDTIALPDLEVASPYAVYAYGSMSDAYPLRWPVTVDADNAITDVADCLPPMGGGYDPLAELAWFSSTFGPRSLPPCAERCGASDAVEGRPPAD